MQVEISERTLEAAIACTEAVANDGREPARYRVWYAEALAELRQIASLQGT